MNHIGDTNKMVSDTPRTEAEVNRQKCWSDDLVTIDANFAAQLERELNAANERIKRLEEAGDAMDPMNDTECECDDRLVLICKYCFDSSTRWFKAKEANP